MAKDGEKLVIGLFDSHPIAISVVTGETIWQAQDVPADIYQTPLIKGNTVYVRNLSHTLFLRNGSAILLFHAISGGF
jgi:outer membrane protein assembly factor BamB